MMGSDKSQDLRMRSGSPTSRPSTSKDRAASPSTVLVASFTVGSGALVLPTVAVVVSQVTFLAICYLDAFFHGSLSAERFHISAVLDDERRSLLCACVGVFGLCSLLWVEATRDLPELRLRSSLASLTGGGICCVCLLREGEYEWSHKLAAALTFGAAVALVCLVASVASSRRGMQAATALVSLVLVTGTAQGSQIISHELYATDILPSWALGALELGLLLGFTGCMCVLHGAGSRPCYGAEAKAR